MNFSAFKSWICSSLRSQFLVIFLLWAWVNCVGSDDVEKSAEEVKNNFEQQLSSCVSDKIDLLRYSSRTVVKAENGFCGNDDDLSTHYFRSEECFANSSPAGDGISRQYCSIELTSKNASGANVNKLCQKRTIKLTWCVPVVCEENDFEEGVINLVLRSDEACLWTKTDSSTVCFKIEEKSSVSLYVYVSFCLFAFVVASIICTVYDQLKNFESKDNDASPLVKLTKDFSVIRNYRKLTDTSVPNEKPCIHLISISTILLIIVGQQQIFSAVSSGSRHDAYRMSSSRCVDVLFVVSGFLTFYYGFKPMQEGRSLFLVVSVVFRWLRMMPIYCVVTLFVMYVLPNLGEEITWKYRMLSEASVCEVQFWKNFFCIANFFESNEECLSISWYIRLDLQLSAIGSILLFIFTKETRAGLVVLSLVVIFSYVFAAVYSAHQLVDEAVRFQSSTYSRIPPYFIGFVIGVILKTVRNKRCDLKFSNIQKLALLATAYSLKIGIVLCDWLIPIDRTSEWSAFTVVTYAASSRWIYLLFEFWVILIFYIYGLGLFDKIIQLKIVIPVGRLSYVALLVSSVIHLFHSKDSERMNGPCSHSIPTLVIWTLIDILSVYFIGFLLHLFFEAPFSRISRRILEHLLWMCAKPAEKVQICDSSLQDESDEYFEKSIDWKSNEKNTDNGSNTSSFYENKAFENDKVVVREL